MSVSHIKPNFYTKYAYISTYNIFFIVPAGTDKTSFSHVILWGCHGNFVHIIAFSHVILWGCHCNFNHIFAFPQVILWACHWNFAHIFALSHVILWGRHLHFPYIFAFSDFTLGGCHCHFPYIFAFSQVMQWGCQCNFAIVLMFNNNCHFHFKKRRSFVIMSVQSIFHLWYKIVLYCIFYNELNDKIFFFIFLQSTCIHIMIFTIILPFEKPSILLAVSH